MPGMSLFYHPDEMAFRKRLYYTDFLKYVPYLSHYFALKIRAKSWVRDIRRYPLSRHEFESSGSLGASRTDVLTS